MSFLHFLLDSFFSLVFPKECIRCGRLGEVWCEDCRWKIEVVNGYLCPGCFRSCIEGMRHDECDEKTSLDGLITALDWKDQTVKDAIHSFKYEGVKELAKFLAVFLNAKIQNSPLFFRFVSECHAVIPIPLHRRNALLRGYNQSELLARELTRFLPIKVHEDIVRKARSTKTQTKLKGIERFENVAQTFQIIPGADVKGGKFVVVDDVVTSGATMNEVAKVLKQNGALLVWGLAVTRG